MQVDPLGLPQHFGILAGLQKGWRRMLIYFGFTKYICTIKKKKISKNKLCVSDRLSKFAAQYSAENSTITKRSKNITPMEVPRSAVLPICWPASPGTCIAVRWVQSLQLSFFSRSTASAPCCPALACLCFPGLPRFVPLLPQHHSGSLQPPQTLHRSFHLNTNQSIEMEHLGFFLLTAHRPAWQGWELHTDHAGCFFQFASDQFLLGILQSW